MPRSLPVPAIEKSTYKVTFGPFKDEEGVVFTPKSPTWSLTDNNGTVVNSRSEVSISPASTINVILSGDDLQLSSTLKLPRKLLLKCTYDSTNGSDLPFKDEASFDIVNLASVT